MIFTLCDFFGVLVFLAINRISRKLEPSEKDDFIRRDDVWLTACSVSAVSSLECASSPQDWAKRLCLSMPTPLPDYRMVSGLDG